MGRWEDGRMGEWEDGRMEKLKNARMQEDDGGDERIMCESLTQSTKKMLNVKKILQEWRSEWCEWFMDLKVE